ncbi:MAG: hypothetical protein QOH11_109, partial [Solirubrobacteraceae bacterium]|nr:hypothetical protein [Solirubrobacteraceae bacterium]
KLHTTIGEQLLEHVPLLGGEGLRVVRSHHERWDGSGYPDGLAGYDIPIASRITFVCDAYDAMTSDRPYRAARSQLVALAELLGGAGQQFCPHCANTLVDELLEGN